MTDNNCKIVVEYDQWQRLIKTSKSSWDKKASINPICYSFNFCCLNHISFNFDNNVKKWHFIAFIETITSLSRETSTTICELNHCHKIRSNKIEEFKLTPLLACCKDKTLYSFGNNAKPVRLIGFFDNDKPYLFHVCLIDWHHQLYAPKPKYVYN